MHRSRVVKCDFGAFIRLTAADDAANFKAYLTLQLSYSISHKSNNDQCKRCHSINSPGKWKPILLTSCKIQLWSIYKIDDHSPKSMPYPVATPEPPLSSFIRNAMSADLYTSWTENHKCMGSKWISGQSYKASMIVIYNSRVVPDLKIPHIMTL